MQSEANRLTPGYLHRIATRAVTPFRYRTGVRRLLGMADADQQGISPPATASAFGVRYLARLPTNDPYEPRAPSSARSDDNSFADKGGLSFISGLSPGRDTAVARGSWPHFSEQGAEQEIEGAPSVDDGGVSQKTATGHRGGNGRSQKENAYAGGVSVEILEQSDTKTGTSFCSPERPAQMPGLTSTSPHGGPAAPRALDEEEDREQKTAKQEVPSPVTGIDIEIRTSMKSPTPADQKPATVRWDMSHSHGVKRAPKGLHFSTSAVIGRTAEGGSGSFGKDVWEDPLQEQVHATPAQRVQTRVAGHFPADRGISPAVNRNVQWMSHDDPVEHIRRVVQEREAIRRGTDRDEDQVPDVHASQSPHPPVKRVIVVSRGRRRGVGDIAAFWERSYLGRFHLRTVR